MAQASEAITYSVNKRFLLDINTIKSIAAYTSVVILCLLVLVWVLNLWQADLTVPLAPYNGDSIFEAMVVKGIIENGWYLYNPNIGFPTGLYLHDYPSADGLHFLLIKLLSFFSSNFGLVMNLTFLLTFPLVAIASLFVFRRFGLSYPAAITASLLYTFIPYHLLRGEIHLRLTHYYIVPLIVLVIIKIYSEKLNLKSLSIVLICLLIASSGIYYAFFAVFFLFVAGLSAATKRKSFYHLLASWLFIAVIVIGALINVAPSLVYNYYHKANTEAVVRPWQDTELYGLKISQLLLPVTEHRMSRLSLLKDNYNTKAMAITENDKSALGVIASLGFLFLISWLFLGKRWLEKVIPRSRIDVIDSLSKLNIAAVLLATVGGFSILLAFFLTSKIRSYNRISIFIAFFSLLALFLLLESLADKFAKQRFLKFAYFGLLAIILAVGLLDQSTTHMKPKYLQIKSDHTIDQQFVRKIELSVPEDTAIFQLPYIPFPESAPVNRMHDYDLLRPYLHSKDLRWSYGAMKGREADLWQRKVVKKPLKDFLNEISKVGFKGLYIDRAGYPDTGVAIEQQLAGLLNVKPIVSSNKRLAFFSMTKYNIIN